MDVQKELGKWKSEYVKCNTPEELADHKKRFKAFLQSLSPEDKKAFAQAFQDGARQSMDEAQAIVKTVEIRQTLEKVYHSLLCLILPSTISAEHVNGYINGLMAVR